MTKRTAIAAAVLAAASLAASAAFVTDSVEPQGAQTSAQASTDDNLRRGTREPVIIMAAAERIGDQPRRGERSDFETSTSPAAQEPEQSTRRGTR